MRCARTLITEINLARASRHQRFAVHLSEGYGQYVVSFEQLLALL